MTEALQIIMVGNSCVGKTSMVKSYIHQKTGVFPPTIGADVDVVYVDIYNNNDNHLSTMKLMVWDTGGQETHRSICSQYYIRANGVILVYDITNLDSFAQCVEWLQEVKAHATKDNVKFILVGNKIDDHVNRKVNDTDGLFFAKNNDMDFIEISAKNGTNLDVVFQTLAKQLFFDQISAKKSPKKENTFNNAAISINLSDSVRFGDTKDKLESTKNCGCLLI